MKPKIIIGLSSFIAIALIIGAVIFTSKSSGDAPSTEDGTETFTISQLAAFNGKNGTKCYVAVDSKVYEIEQGRLWQNGTHTTSNEQAHCGKDLTEAISKSPHGRSKLSGLAIKGTLQK